MPDLNEIVRSTHDAATLSAVLATFSPYEATAPGAAEELTEMLAGARLVAPGALGRDIVGLDSDVTYVELPVGHARTVRLVHPAAANASAARVSVLAPFARSLPGRPAGARVPAALPHSATDHLPVSARRSAGPPPNARGAPPGRRPGPSGARGARAHSPAGLS